MPELPEVITIRNDLEKEIKNKTIVEILSFENYRPEAVNLIKKNAVGKKIVGVSNIAKLILLHLDNGEYLATHLNMSGRLLYNTSDPYVKLALKFNTNDILHYSSIRMFGYFEHWLPVKVEEYSKRYGKVALDPTLALSDFISNLKRSNTYIKNNLLNQKFVSGIGNIYANDALHMSSIHPKRRTHSISDIEYKALFDNVKKILNEGIEHRGSTIDRYSDLYGKPGSHQNHFRIYGKRGQKCSNCGGSVTFEAIQGRGTFYCENCQPIEPKSNQPSLF